MSAFIKKEFGHALPRNYLNGLIDSARKTARDSLIRIKMHILHIQIRQKHFPFTIFHQKMLSSRIIFQESESQSSGQK